MEFNWHTNKNTKLKELRGVSFEQVIQCIFAGNYKIQPNRSKNHIGQRVFVVQIKGVAWLVPFRNTSKGYFLSTIMRRDKK